MRSSQGSEALAATSAAMALSPLHGADSDVGMADRSRLAGQLPGEPPAALARPRSKPRVVLVALTAALVLIGGAVILRLVPGKPVAPESRATQASIGSPVTSREEPGVAAALKSPPAEPPAAVREAPVKTPGPEVQNAESKPYAIREPPARRPAKSRRRPGIAQASRSTEVRPEIAAIPESPPTEERVGEPARSSAQPGFLSLDTAPWSNVYLGGKLLGATPLIRLALPPGRHVLTLKNPESGSSATYVVEIKSGTSLSRLVGLEK